MIYFLRCEQDSGGIKTGWVKIGTTVRLSVRLKQISDKLGHTPTVLGVLDGGYAEEKALHDTYKDFRRCGEWFDPENSDLFKLISDEARTWDAIDDAPVPIPAMVTAKMDRALVARAKFVAETRELSLAEYLSGVARLVVDRDFAEETRGE